MITLIWRKEKRGGQRKLTFSHGRARWVLLWGLEAPLLLHHPASLKRGALRGEGGAQKRGDPWRPPGKRLCLEPALRGAAHSGLLRLPVWLYTKGRVCVGENRGRDVFGVRSAGSWAPDRGRQGVAAARPRAPACSVPLSCAPCPSPPGPRGLASAPRAGLGGPCRSPQFVPH